MKEYEAILRLFKGAMVREGDKIVETPSEKALKQGVFISAGFPESVIDEAIKQYGRNGEEANQTFHKSLFKVATADLVQLYFEQLIHYFTTYGAEELGIYNADNVFIPKEKLEVPELLLDTELVVIKPLTEKEVRERIRDMITVNLALSKQTVKDIVLLSDYIDIKEYSKGDSYFCEIKNKEVKSALCGKLGILPKRGDEFLRYFLAKKCDRTLLIKDAETERAISWIGPEETLELLERYRSQYGLIELSKVFNRFKPLFLSMKAHEKEAIRSYYTKEDRDAMTRLNKHINYISKMSKKYHKPLKQNDLNDFINWLNNLDVKQEEDFKEIVKAKLNEAGIYTTIKLANYLERMYYNELDYNLYKVRNGRIYVKDGFVKPYLPMFNVALVKDIVKDRLRKNVSGKTVYVPSDIDYKLPQSEKQFVGNIPFGSSVSVKKQSLLVGIHWKNVEDKQGNEHRVDLDLHLTSNKYNVGWNTSYREEDGMVLFTGDNTNAPLPNGASEFIYIDSRVEDTSFAMKINNYTRDVGPIPYEIIIGVAEKDVQYSNNRDYIIDPNNILVRIPMEMELGQAEQIIGVVDVSDDEVRLIFTDMTISDRRVSSNKEFEKKVRNFVKEQSNTQLSLASMLYASGANVCDKPVREVEIPYVMDEDMKLITQEEADEKGIAYTGDEMFFKKEEIPVDFNFSLEALTKDSFIKLLKE